MRRIAPRRGPAALGEEFRAICLKCRCPSAVRRTGGSGTSVTVAATGPERQPTAPRIEPVAFGWTKGKDGVHTGVGEAGDVHFVATISCDAAGDCPWIASLDADDETLRVHSGAIEGGRGPSLEHVKVRAEEEARKHVALRG